MNTVVVGQIRKLLPEKYCGFISISGGQGKDYFFHVSGMDPETMPYAQLREGMTVEFTPTESHKGLRAEGVRVVE